MITLRDKATGHRIQVARYLPGGECEVAVNLLQHPVESGICATCHRRNDDHVLVGAPGALERVCPGAYVTDTSPPRFLSKLVVHRDYEPVIPYGAHCALCRYWSWIYQPESYENDSNDPARIAQYMKHKDKDFAAHWGSARYCGASHFSHNSGLRGFAVETATVMTEGDAGALFTRPEHVCAAFELRKGCLLPTDLTEALLNHLDAQVMEEGACPMCGDPSPHHVPYCPYVALSRAYGRSPR